MDTQDKSQYLMIASTAIGLFIFQNFLAAGLIPSLLDSLIPQYAQLIKQVLGNSMTGIMPVAAATVLSLAIRKPQAIILQYAIYGLIAVPFHLLVRDYYYMAVVLMVVLAAGVFAYFIHKFGYRLWSYIAGFALFLALSVAFSSAYLYVQGHPTSLDLGSNSITLFAGLLTILASYLAYKKNP